MKYIKYLLLCLVVMASAACSTLNKLDSTSQLVVQYATVKFIHNTEDPEDSTERAERIIEIATEGQRLFSERTLPISGIERLIRGQIDWHKLDAADAVLVNALISQVVEDIESKVDMNNDVYLSGGVVMDWIVSGARMSGV
ncbi:MAG: hypothetical protein K6L81_01865 [Agarilytica sp.]